jgi:hypothetical protein
MIPSPRPPKALQQSPPQKPSSHSPAQQPPFGRVFATAVNQSITEPADAMLSRMSDPPAMRDIILYLDSFIRRLHQKFVRLKKASKVEVFEAYRTAAEEDLLPFDRRWSKRTLYPVRNDSSIFLSIASYRDHRLENTLKEAFGKAAHPGKLFAGVVMQNCREQCKTGVLVVSPPGQRPPKTEVRDAPPDVDGVRDFCTSGAPWSDLCDGGHVRLLSVREQESLGPCVARYFASKLWGGEEYFVQIDSHIWFAKGWDEKLRDMMSNAPSTKPVISTYPPGYGGNWEGGRGPRMCGASFSTSPVEARIIRIGASMASKQPTGAIPNTPIAAPYVAAGFFAAPSQFLGEMPFDPLLPWVFMGEEIMLSTRFFTNGYDIFAPSQNILAHEYRPGSMGLPKFWETVGRMFGRPGFNTQLMLLVICRVKNHLGYPECLSGGKDIHPGVLSHQAEYGMGRARSLAQYMKMAQIDMNKMTLASHLEWCAKGEDPPMDGWSYS